jgi:hypothetical protein
MARRINSLNVVNELDNRISKDVAKAVFPVLSKMGNIVDSKKVDDFDSDSEKFDETKASFLKVDITKHRWPRIHRLRFQLSKPGNQLVITADASLDESPEELIESIKVLIDSRNTFMRLGYDCKYYGEALDENANSLYECEMTKEVDLDDPVAVYKEIDQLIAVL